MCRTQQLGLQLRLDSVQGASLNMQALYMISWTWPYNKVTYTIHVWTIDCIAATYMYTDSQKLQLAKYVLQMDHGIPWQAWLYFIELKFNHAYSFSLACCTN